MALMYSRQPVSPFGEAVLVRIATRLHENLDRHLFGHTPKFEGEQQAMALLKGIGLELQRAADALLEAAETLKAKGHGHQANRVHLAYLRARDQAGALHG
jgi:hypothetical protein